MMAHPIDTLRLRLRPLDSDDVGAVHRLWVSRGVRRYLWDDVTIPYEHAAAAIAESIALFARSGYGLWGVRRANEDDLIGFCGYWYLHEPPELELVYGLSEPHWNKGLATEMASAMIRHGFDALGFTRIQASADAANVASIRVMEKAAMRFLRRQISDGLDTVYYVADGDSAARRP